MDAGSTIRAIDDAVDVLTKPEFGVLLSALFPIFGDPEVAELTREALLLGKEFLEAGIEDPAAQMRELRAKIRDDWRAALAAKFPRG